MVVEMWGEKMKGWWRVVFSKNDVAVCAEFVDLRDEEE
jgi:hypothetical protein